MSKIKLPHASGNSMSIGAPATNPASDLELKLPATIGTANQLLKNSGTAGTLEFSSNLTFDGNLITGTHTSGNVGLELHATGSGIGNQTKYHNDHGEAYIGQAGDTSGNLLIHNTSNTDIRLSTNNTERVRINESGRVDIGGHFGSEHGSHFQVVNTTTTQSSYDCLSYFETAAVDWCIKTNYNVAGSHYHLFMEEQGTNRGMIHGSDGSNVQYAGGSDYRWKENVVEMTGTEGIDICKKLKPSYYNWIDNRVSTGKINTVDGFIAHEVEEAGIKGAVWGEKDAVNEDGSVKGQMLDYGQITPALAAAIKGLITKIETLETKVAALEAA